MTACEESDQADLRLFYNALQSHKRAGCWKDTNHSQQRETFFESVNASTYTINAHMQGHQAHHDGEVVKHHSRTTGTHATGHEVNCICTASQDDASLWRHTASNPPPALGTSHSTRSVVGTGTVAKPGVRQHAAVAAWLTKPTENPHQHTAMLSRPEGHCGSNINPVAGCNVIQHHVSSATQHLRVPGGNTHQAQVAHTS